MSTNNVVVILKFLSGNFSDGFELRLEIVSDGQIVNQQRYSLPGLSDIDLHGQYERWIQAHEALAKNYDYLSYLELGAAKGGFPTSHAQFSTCYQAAENIKSSLKVWWNDVQFRLLAAEIKGNRYVKADDSVPILLDSSINNLEVDALLRRLPWHLWSLFQELNNAEFALATRFQEKRLPLKPPVRILAVLGDDSVTTIEESQAGKSSGQKQAVLPLIENIKAMEELLGPQGAIIKVLGEKEVEELSEAEELSKVEKLSQLLRDPRGWDIFFFTGHSTSEKGVPDGQLKISKDHTISLSDLENDFKFAIKHGLKLAIFNSCKGLGIVDFFADWGQTSRRFSNLSIPNLIVMREPVPDFIARRFFRELVKGMVDGKPLYKSVRNARETLTAQNGAEKPFICADWNPVICLSPNQPEEYWPLVKDIKAKPERLSSNKLILGIVFCLLLLTSISIAYRLFTLHLGEPGSSLKGESSTIGENLFLEEKELENITSGNPEVQQQCLSNFKKKELARDNFLRFKYTAAKQLFEEFHQLCKQDIESDLYAHNSSSLKDGENFRKMSLKGSAEVIRIAVFVPMDSDMGVALEKLRGVQNFYQEHDLEGAQVQFQLVREEEKILEKVSELLVSDPSIFAVVGPYGSKKTEKIARMYEESIVLVSSDSSAVREEAHNGILKEPLQLNSSVFRMAPTDYKLAKKIVDSIKQDKSTGVILAYDTDDPYSRSFRELIAFFSEKEEISIFDSNTCDMKPSNNMFSSKDCLTQGESGNADTLIWIPDPNIKRRSFEIIKDNAGRDKPFKVYAGDSAYSSGVLKELGDVARGMIVAIPWHETGEAPSNILNEGENMRTGLTYDAISAIVTGWQNLGEKPDRKDLKDELLQPSFSAHGFLGNHTIQFSDSNDLSTGIAIGDRLLNEKLGVLVEVVCRYSKNRRIYDRYFKYSPDVSTETNGCPY